MSGQSGFSEESSHDLGGVQPRHLLDRLPVTRHGKKRVVTAALLGVAALAFSCVMVQNAPMVLGSVAGATSPPVSPKVVQEVLGDMQETLEHIELEDLKRSPRVQHLAAKVPEVRAMLEDPAKAQQLVNLMHAGAKVLKSMRADVACPADMVCAQGTPDLAALTELSRELLARVEAVLRDPAFQELLPGAQAGAPTVGSLAGLFTSADGFQAGLRASAPSRGSSSMAARKAARPKRDKFAAASGSDISAGDIGVTEPLGIFDPGNFMTNTASYAPFPWAPPQPQFKPDDTKYRRWQEMEIKHGRIAMLATIHVLVTTFGIKWPYINLAIGDTGLSEFDAPIAFTDVPGGTWASWAAVPAFGWAQIVGLVFALDVLVFGQDPEKEAGDVVPDFLPWVRYDDTKPYEAPLGKLWPFPGTYTFPSEKAYKLNVERNNGRAAMLGIFGMMFHEALTGNPVWPIPADVEGGVFAALGA